MNQSPSHSFSIAHVNSAHNHVFPNLKNVSQRRSFGKNSEIDDFLKLRMSQNMENKIESKNGEIQADEQQPFQSKTNKAHRRDQALVQLNKSHQSSIFVNRSNQTFCVAAAEFEIMENSNSKINSEECNRLESNQIKNLIQKKDLKSMVKITDSQPIKYSLAQLSQSVDSNQTDPDDTEKKTMIEKYKQENLQQENLKKIYSQNRKKRKDQSEVSEQCQNAFFDAKNNAVFPGASAYNSKANSNGSKNRKPKKQSFIKGLPYTEPINAKATKTTNNWQPSVKNAYNVLNATSQISQNASIGVKNQMRILQHGINDYPYGVDNNVRTIVSANNKSQIKTPDSSSYKIRKSFFNEEQIMVNALESGMVLLTQQNFQSKSQKRHKNQAEEESVFSRSKRQKDSIISNRTGSNKSKQTSSLNKVVNVLGKRMNNAVNMKHVCCLSNMRITDDLNKLEVVHQDTFKSSRHKNDNRTNDFAITPQNINKKKFQTKKVTNCQMAEVQPINQLSYSPVFTREKSLAQDFQHQKKATQASRRSFDCKSLSERRENTNVTSITKSISKTEFPEIQFEQRNKSECINDELNALPQIKQSCKLLSAVESKPSVKQENSRMENRAAMQSSKSLLHVDSINQKQEAEIFLPQIQSKSKLPVIASIAVNNFEDTLVTKQSFFEQTQTSIQSVKSQGRNQELSKRNSFVTHVAKNSFGKKLGQKMAQLQPMSNRSKHNISRSSTMPASNVSGKNIVPEKTLNNSLEQDKANSLDSIAQQKVQELSCILNNFKQENTNEKLGEITHELKAGQTDQFIIQEEGFGEETSQEAESKDQEEQEKPQTAVTPQRINYIMPQSLNYASRTEQSMKSPRPSTTPHSSSNIQIQNSESASLSQARKKESIFTSVAKNVCEKNEKSPQRLQIQSKVAVKEPDSFQGFGIQQERSLQLTTITPQKGQRIMNNKGQDNTIYCQAMFSEPFYRRAMIKLCWTLVNQQQSQQKSKFHIKFDVDDLQRTAAEIKNNQFYNHFPNNRECVTKAGLCKNLWFNNLSEQDNQVAQFFPRCYDLSDLKQTQEFIIDFNQTAILSIIKMIAVFFQKTNPIVLEFVEQIRQKSQFNHPAVYKIQLKKRCRNNDKKSQHCGNLVGCHELRLAYSFAKELYNKIKFRDNKQKKGKIYKIDIEEQQIEVLLKFQSKLVDQGIPSLPVETYEQVKIVKLNQDLMKEMQQYRQIDGFNNIWIVKPSYNSRGIGIYCARQLNQIIIEGKKIQQKVVQKYIERPLFVNENKKFDLRQWVLVNSWEPLDVCVFSSAYLKICSQSFDLNKLDDLNRHLSNFTINKQFIGEDISNDEIVMSTDQFEDYMQKQALTRKEIPKDFKWKKHVLPKIKDLVWRTLKSIQDTQEQRNNCFEVFGFDIVLDQDLNLWLIEVNLSPACSERTQWLIQMLDEKSLALLSYVQQKILITNPSESWTVDKQTQRKVAFREQEEQKYSKNINSQKFFEVNKPKDRWLRIEESIREIKIFNKIQNFANEQKVELALVGVKSNLKFEKRLEKSYRQEKSAFLIQRIWRGYKGRTRFTQIYKSKYALVIQRHARMYFAKRLALNMRQTDGAKLVQKYLRQIIAYKLTVRLKATRILRQKTSLVIKIQSQYRRKKAQSELKYLQKQKAALKLQTMIKGYLARKRAHVKMDYRCKTILIQKYYKKRYMKKMLASKVIQKYLRGFTQKNKVIKLLKISQASKTLRQLLNKACKCQGLRKLKENAKAIIIQKYIRGLIIRKKCKLMLKTEAQKRIKKFFRKQTLKALKTTSNLFKNLITQKTIMVQKYLRGKLAQKAAKRIRIKIVADKAASLIQKYLRGYLATQDANQR